MESKDLRRHREYLVKKRDLRKGRIKRLRAIEEGSKSDFWKNLEEEIDISIKASEYSREEVLDPETMTDPVVSAIRSAFYKGKIQAYKGIALNVTKADSKIQSINMEVSEITRQLRELEGKTTGRSK